jgi:hypothetical protein
MGDTFDRQGGVHNEPTWRPRRGRSDGSKNPAPTPTVAMAANTVNNQKKPPVKS